MNPRLRPEPPALPFPAHREVRAAPSRDDVWDHCPNCGARLHNAGCKYRCPGCFYFMSFYFMSCLDF